MDIIKFRVWDNEQQEYLDTDILHVKNDGTLFISKKGENPWSALLSAGCNSERFVIEPATSLKGNGSTEIYKNDICSFNSKKGEYMGVVEWADDLASFGLRLVKDNILYTFPVLDITGADLDTLEVVGNVHHNRELLKDGVL